MIVLCGVAWPAAMYTAVHLRTELFRCTNCFLTRFVFSQVGFAFYFWIINTAFNVHFVIAIELGFIVDVVFLFHGACLIVIQK
jgi:hypothetical protein